ncbi:MAG: glycosyltransferase family 2 protein [Clostridia bacterium]|nr:glycosyltransferase family 2 protein [Clostridia bacterium]
MKPHSITVLTPTYNRAHLLRPLYESLKAQTTDDFCWLVVDDGSTDDTEALIASFVTEGGVDITYVKQENHGKYVAHNTGVRLASTELIVCVDSDDTLYPHALARVLEVWQTVGQDPAIAGIVSPRDMKGQAYMVNPPPTSSLMALYNRGQLVGDTMLVFRREVLARYPFPEVEGENFMSECVVYHQIDHAYRLAVLQEYLYCSAYQSDGLTRNIRRMHWKNPRATLIMYHAIAAWQTNLLAACKAYGAYLAWKRVRGLSSCHMFTIKPHVAFLGSLLRPHYQKIFRSEQAEYDR